MTNEEHVNYIHAHHSWHKCQTVDINSIQCNFVHIRITHATNMHVVFEINMIIIRSYIENITCSMLPILQHISISFPLFTLPECLCVPSEKMGNIIFHTCICNTYIYNTTL